MTAVLENTQHIIVDFYRNSYTYINAKQGDVGTRHLIVTFTNDGIEFPLDSTTMKCDFKMQKPDNHVIYNPVEILEDGTVHIEFKDNYLCVAGIANAELIVTEVETENVLSTMAFHINILTAVENEIIESTNEFGTLEKDLKALHKALDDVEVVNENEEIRQANEATRKTNETTRVSAESSRVSAEKTRNSNETSRKNAETARVTAENTRVSAESARDTAEITRVSNENARKTAETARATAETDRASAETTRNTKETARQSAEDTRISNETSRVNAEKTRDTNEINRKSAETARANAETTRKNNETTRQTNETNRQSAEVTRDSEETKRVTAETTRSTNETNRINAEKTRTTAESSRESAETARATAETTRGTNETARISAEATRQSNETTRVNAETARVTAETARAKADADRTTLLNDLKTDLETEIANSQNLNVVEEKATDSYKVVITKKDGTQVFSPNLLNKISIGEIDTIMFGETATASLSGEFGEQKLNIGVPCGKPFTIANTYASAEEMNADIDNISEYDFVIIDSDKASDDQGKLYIKENNLLRYVMTMGSSALSEETIIGALGYDPKNLKVTTVIESNSSSTSLENSVDGKIKLEKLIADSYQKHLSGKNFLDNVGVTLTDCGITFTVNSDKSIATKGTSTDVAGFLIVEGMSIPSGKYRLSGCPLDGSELSYYMLVILNDGASDDDWKYDFGDGVEIELTDNDVVNCMIIIGSDQTIDKTFYPMITLASETDQTYEPYCGGTASPNPSYPQTIHSTGDSGWFDGEWIIGYYTGTTIITHSSYLTSKTKYPCVENDKIELKLNKKHTYLSILFFNEAGELFAREKTEQNENTYDELTAIVPSGATHFVYEVCSTGITAENVGLEYVTINGQYAVIVDEVGKNLLDVSIYADTKTQSGLTFTKDESLGFKLEGTTIASAYLATSGNDGKISKLSKGTYFLSGGSTKVRAYLIYYGSDGISAGTEYDSGQGVTITFEEDVTYYAQCYCPSGYTYDEYFQPMLRKCDSNGNPIGNDIFAPYQHNRTYIPISEPLRAVDDVKDEIVVQNGEYGAFRKRSLQLFNGTEDGWQYTNGTFRYTLPYLKVPNVDETNYLCDYFTPINYSASWSNYETFVSNVSDVVVFKMPSITTVEAWKAWLVENPIKFEYELKTPVFEPFADQTPFYNLLSYDDVTNVSIVGLHENVEPTFAMRFPRNEDGALVMDGWSKGNLASIKVEKNNSITDDEIIAIFNEVFG